MPGFLTLCHVWQDEQPSLSGLCKDCSLVDGSMASHANIIFARVTRPEFVMDAAQLSTALALVAKRKGSPVSDVHSALDSLCDLLPDTAEQAFFPEPCEEPMDRPEDKHQLTLSCIEEALTSGEAVLLQAHWLLELGKNGGVLPKRRDLPEKATWPPELIMKMVNEQKSRQSKAAGALIVAVSCFWQTLEHPDPHGRQLQALCHTLERRLGNNRKNDRLVADIAIFWDFASLSQERGTRKDKTVPAEELERSLNRRAMWYTHPNIEVWMVSEDSPDVFSCHKSCST